MSQKARYKLDLSNERLLFGDQPVRLGNKAFDVLRFFVNNPNRLLTKDEIIDGVWHDTFVSEGLIREYVHDLRHALGDHPRNSEFIETVHGRGYRFLGGVDIVYRSTTVKSLAHPDKPAIAVLAFANLSGDADAEYFSDGLSEEIITELSRFRSLVVIARNSSFVYKGRSVNARDIGLDLGVRYLIEGSVQRVDDLVRVTAQLIETEAGRHLWAESYDRELKDIFSLQDEMTHTIAAVVEPELGNVERERSRMKAPENLDAWDLYQRGLWHLYRETQLSNEEAQRYFERSIALSPEFAPAQTALAYVLCFDIINGYSERSTDMIEQAHSTAKKALSLDQRDAMAHAVLGRIQLLRCRHEESIAELETALRLNPNLADAYHGLGFVLTMSGRPEEALSHFETASRLSPYDPRAASFHEMRAWALLMMGRHREAAESARSAVRNTNADIWAYSTLAAVLGHLGHIAEARPVLQDLLKRNPKFSLGFVRRFVFYIKNRAHLEFYLEGLRRAGLRE